MNTYLVISKRIKPKPVVLIAADFTVIRMVKPKQELRDSTAQSAIKHLFIMSILFHLNRVDKKSKYISGMVYIFDQYHDYLGSYSFLMDARTLLPVYVQKDGPKLYYYTKKNYLIYEEASKEDYIAIVEFTEKDHQPLTMELLSKGKVKKNKVDSKGFKQIIL